jgi:hypothetical protein
MEPDLLSLILSSSGVTDLVGQRVTWGARPQGVGKPDIALLLVSGVPDYHMQGESGLDASLVQVDIRSDASLKAAGDIRDAVRAVLSGYSGTVGSTTFYGIFLRSVRQRVEQAEGGGMAYLIQMDWDIQSRAAA